MVSPANLLIMSWNSQILTYLSAEHVLEAQVVCIA